MVAGFAALLALTAAWSAALATPAEPETRDRSAVEQEEGSLRDRAVAALSDGKFVRARELAETILQSTPDDIVGLYVLASALHQGEGNIPRAFHLIRQAKSLVESRGGLAGTTDVAWHESILRRELWILSDLGRYNELIEVAAKIRRLYEPDFFAVNVWPHMKQGDVEQARAAAARAIATGNPYEEVVARNGLCALDGSAACEKMLESVRAHDLNPGLALRNVGVALAGVGEYERAEALLVESTEHPTPDVNPWTALASLYIEEGRLAEAASAAREMVSYARHMPPRERQYSRAGELSMSASVLLLAGHPGRAALLTGQALDQPDRAAHWSGSSDEIEADIHLLARAVHLTLAEMAGEAAGALPVHSGLGQRLTAWRHRVKAWMAGRRLAPLLLEGGLRLRETPEERSEPSLAAPSWLHLDAVALFGPGPTLDLVAQARERGGRPDSTIPRHIRTGYLAALETEALALLGDEEGCLAAGHTVLESFSPAEALLRARVAFRMAEAARALGDWPAAAPLYDNVLRHDPGLFRRLGAPLPVAIGRCEGELGCGALDAAMNTGRLTRDGESPFVLGTASGGLCLATRAGAQLACVELSLPHEPPPEDTTGNSQKAGAGHRSPPDAPLRAREVDVPASRIGLALVQRLFTVQIDLSQQALDSLDGAPTTDRGLDETTLGDLLREP